MRTLPVLSPPRHRRPDGRAMYNRWFNCVQNHTVLRYVRGWDRVDRNE
ncbi:hypothetical protein [Longimicrobium sp.]